MANNKFLEEAGLARFWSHCKKLVSDSGNKNENLLINGDFRNPVNQRGQSSYTFSSKRLYTIDRFYIVNTNTKVSVNSGYIGVTIAKKGSSLGGEFGQITEIPIKTLNSVTFSIKLYNDSKIYSATFSDLSSINATPTTFLNKAIYQNIHAVIYNFNGSTSLFLTNMGASDTTINLEYFKVEQGEVCTGLETVEYGEMLTKCQRYYQVINGTSCINAYPTDSSSNRMLGFSFITDMRTIPTITVTSLKTTYSQDIGVSKFKSFENLQSNRVGTFFIDTNTSDRRSVYIDVIADAEYH